MSTGVARPTAPVVALDIGNVCLRLTPDRWAQGFGYDSLGHLLDHGKDALQLATDFETGRCDTAAFLAGMKSRILTDLDEDSLRTAWDGILGEEMPDMAGVVDFILARGWRPVFLSDICPLHIATVRRTLSFAHLVPAAVVSFEVGALKPAAAMYAAMEQQHCAGRVPLLYADDKLDNVRAARARGWRAYHFGTAEGLLAELVEVSQGL